MAVLSSMHEKLIFDLLNRAEIEADVIELQKSYNQELSNIIDKFISIFELYNNFVHELKRIKFEEIDPKRIFEFPVSQVESPLKEKNQQMNTTGFTFNSINQNAKHEVGYTSAFFKGGNMIKKVCKKQKSNKIVNKYELNNLNITIACHDKENSVPQGLLSSEGATAPENNLLKNKTVSSNFMTRAKPSLTSVELIAISNQTDQTEEYFNGVKVLSKEDSKSSKSSSISKNVPTQHLLKKSFVRKGTILKNGCMDKVKVYKNLSILEKINTQAEEKQKILASSQQSKQSLINITEAGSSFTPFAEEKYLSMQKPLYYNKFRAMENKANYIRQFSSNEKADLISSFIGANHNALDMTVLKNEDLRELKQLKNEVSIYKAYIESVNSKLEIEKKHNLKIQKEYYNYDNKHNSILKTEIDNLLKCFQTYRDFYEEELNSRKLLIEELLIEIDDLKLK